MPRKRPNEPIGPTTIPGQPLDPKIPPDQRPEPDDRQDTDPVPVREPDPVPGHPKSAMRKVEVTPLDEDTAFVLVLVQGLRIPGLTAAEKAQGGRPMRQIVRQPAYIVALTSSMFGYGVMTLVMSATPLAMLACGFEFQDSATVIQAHVIAMFLPSFFTGHLIARFGVLPIIATGALIQMACAIINLAGIAFWNFFLANALVGLGWNFTFVGGTSLLTTTYAPAERAKVQASHDFAVYGTTATAAGLSGVLQANVGWTVVNLAALPMMGVVLLGALWLSRTESGRATAPVS